MSKKVKDLTGKKFSRLTALRNVGPQGKSRNNYWESVCECGTVVKVNGAFLTNGTTKSCGCLQREKARIVGVNSKKHGLSKSRTYRIWSCMIQRCSNPKVDSYKYYGASGIKVCDRWNTFANFLADMGECPSGLSIDRIDSKNGYSPDNCRWASIITQARNTSRNRFYTHQGATRCLPEWAEITGINRAVLQSRITIGWSIERALTEPVRSQRTREHCGQFSFPQ